MLTSQQIDRMLGKVRRYLTALEPHIFEKVGELTDVYAFETADDYHSIPAPALFKKAESGMKWGGESHYCWFKSDYRVPKALAGKDLFLRPRIGGYEAMLWVDGVPFGTYATKIVFTGHGNHYCDMIKKHARAGEKIGLALEYYAGHSFKGCAPFEDAALLTYDFSFSGADICVKNDEIAEFYFDLEALIELEDSLPDTSFRKAELIDALYEVHNSVYYSYDDAGAELFLDGMRKARPFVKKALAEKNGPEAPKAYIIGHSHMDTAWLWHVGETVKKCARTYSNQINLMEQYPEYKFIQSSACHSDFIREFYPELFKRIQRAVKDKRYEPNGGVWVECDCNITSGESMVRQFLWGQRFTREYFGYTANCFWLPDTFGYSAAIPQIMKGCSVDYFMTTKIGWNDTNVFPYDTFRWQGIDGTCVFTHFNRTHLTPTPDEFIRHTTAVGRGVGIKEKTVNDKVFISYGYGDGGGGPQFEQIEAARRTHDLNGCPKTEYMFAGDFMKELERTSKYPETYKGELYLELHRGTLTNQHQIKRNNRKAELALRELEYFTVCDALKNGVPASDEKTHPLWKTLLLNQFHDILPGTCIPRAHKESKEQTSRVISTSKALTAEYTSGSGNFVTLTNTLSFTRNDPVFVKVKKGYMLENVPAQQRYENLDGENVIIASGIEIPAFSSVTLRVVKGSPEAKKLPFSLKGSTLKTPFAKLKFDKSGCISSFYDTAAQRELKGDGYALNTFLVAEDVPLSWDNWDLDADIETKFKPASELVSRETVSEGEAAVIIRSTYKLTDKSSVTQDMMFFAATPEVRFDTLMHWNDDHRFLKAAFDTSVTADEARCEVQFGFVKRPTTRNNSIEKAKFEISNHKYTDISESRYGVSLLNDCKYGISANGGSLRLSLHKGGTRPDFTGDHGEHRVTYSLLAHNSPFSAESVTRPAYELNIPVTVSDGEYRASQLIVPEQSDIIVESIKPCEDAQKAFIARLYECEGAYTHTGISVFDGAKKVEVTNMLEEPTGEIIAPDNAVLTFRPFEIKTLKISY